MKPIIGISLDFLDNKTYSPRPWYALRHDYADAITQYGGIPVFLTYTEDNFNEYLDLIDGLIIPGGDDHIPPHFYEETIKYPKHFTSGEMRSVPELKLLKMAIERKNIAILCICHGMQLMNVAYGGTLIQYIPEEVTSNIEHLQSGPKNIPTHNITIFPDTKLSQIASKSELMINSSHMQAVKKVADRFVISAKAPDGVIEAIEDPNHPFLIGCQWHPEYVINNGIDIELFESFIINAKKIKNDKK